MKKALSLLMAFIMFVGIFTNVPMVLQTNAAQVDITAKIEGLKKIFPAGSYFTTTGKASSGSGAAECYYPSVAKAKGFNWSGMWGSWSCCGFAHFAFRYIFGYEFTNLESKARKVNNTGIESIRSLLSNCKTGDIIQWHYKTGGDHWVMVLSADNNGVYCYDCNNGGECMVYNRTFSYQWISNKASWVKVYPGTGEVTVTNKPTGWYKVSVGNSYLNIRSGAGTNYSAVGKAYNGDCYEIEKTEGFWGKIKGKSQWIHLSYCQQTTPPVVKPVAPSLVLAQTDIAKGKTVTIKWNSVSGATSYRIVLSNGQEQTVTGTSATFKIDTAGEYTAVGYAKNSLYTSVVSAKTAKITVHEPVTVTFEDYDGTVVSSQTIDYGNSAQAPESLSRTGYTFVGWDKSFSSVKSDLVVKANYQINSYSVKFFDKDNNQIGSTQKVDFGENAVPPTETNAPTGYVFADWSNKSYINVGSDGGENGKVYSVHAIYAWYNQELPIYVKITSAVRQEDGYYVYFNLTNYPQSVTRGRAVVTLKTAEGKLVDTTESAAFSIPANGTKTGVEVFIPCEKAASKIEVIVVDSYSSGVPISQSATSAIDQSDMWSDWSTVRPEGEDIEVESRTEYRCRDKKYTTSSSSSLSGWTLYNTTATYSDWKSTTSVVTSSNTREVKTKTVPATYKTQYVYKRYKYYNKSAGTYYYSYASTWATNMGYSGWWEYKYSDTQLNYVRSYDGVPCYYGTGSNSWYKANCNNQGSETSFTKSVVATAAYTVYEYRDISYTYHFYKWDDSSWSDWSTSNYTATNDRQVESRVCYRGKSISLATEDNSGEKRVVSGNVSKSFAGKMVTLYVYKVTEASDWTNEFIGQQQIGDDGSYSFTFKLREEPSAITGDYTVAIGIEGTTNLIVIDTIEAPKPQYTVNFYDKNGIIISTQIVTEGENAEAPVLEDVTGYTFACWDARFTNVKDNLDIMPVYVPKQYAVVFIDEMNDTVSIENFNYGDPLEVEKPEEVIGYDFIGWDIEGNNPTIVTDNLVARAQYKIKSFNVTFLDYKGEVLNTQVVEYGKHPEIPELSGDKELFLYWSCDVEEDGGENYIITSDTVYTPIYAYEETAQMPYASIAGGRYESYQQVELLSNQENATIYYTIDGTDPTTSDTAKEYDEPLLISDGVIVKFYASVAGMNDSDVASESYITNRSPWMIYDTVPDYIKKSPKTYEVKTDYGYYYKQQTVTTKYVNEAAQFASQGWIENVDAQSYTEYSEWYASEMDLSNFIDPVIESTIVDGVVWYRYKSVIKTYERYVCELEEPTANVDYQEVIVYSYKYPAKSFVNVKGMDNDFTFIVLNGSKIDKSVVEGFENCLFDSAYTDSAYLNVWDFDVDTVSEDMSLYLKYSVKQYDVTFYDIDKNILEVMTVKYGETITVPEAPVVDGYVFVGWEIEKGGEYSDIITENTSYVPKYVSEDEYVKVSLTRSKLTIMKGTVATLSVIVTPSDKVDSEFVWFSSNPEVATIDASGTLTGMHSGTTIITVVSLETYESSNCVVTVLGTADEEILPLSESTITVDAASKFIYGIKPKENTITTLDSKFENDGLRYFDSNGEEITDKSSYVGTGSYIKLIDGTTVVDEVEVVIRGDINGDGFVNVIDAFDLERCVNQHKSVEGAYMEASDVTEDDEINVNDYALIVNEVLKNN